MAEMRAEADKFSTDKYPGTRVFIGETYLPNIAELLKQYGSPEHPEFQLPMDTQIGFINKLDVAAFRAKIQHAETDLGNNVPLLIFDNHDNPRLDARYGDGVHDTDIERVISTMLFASRGASLFYYGDEIGMKTTPPTRKEDVKDPVGITWLAQRQGPRRRAHPHAVDARSKRGLRDPRPSPGSRSRPMQPPSTWKLRRAIRIHCSRWYQTLIRLKKTNPAFSQGSDTMLDTENTNVLSWKRGSPRSASCRSGPKLHRRARKPSTCWALDLPTVR